MNKDRLAEIRRRLNKIEDGEEQRTSEHREHKKRLRDIEGAVINIASFTSYARSALNNLDEFMKTYIKTQAQQGQQLQNVVKDVSDLKDADLRQEERGREQDKERWKLVTKVAVISAVLAIILNSIGLDLDVSKVIPDIGSGSQIEQEDK